MIPVIGGMYYLHGHLDIKYICRYTGDTVSFFSSPEECAYQTVSAAAYGKILLAPKTYSLWVNVYAEGVHQLHNSRSAADACNSGRIKCIELKYEV